MQLSGSTFAWPTGGSRALPQERRKGGRGKEKKICHILEFHESQSLLEFILSQTFLICLAVFFKAVGSTAFLKLKVLIIILRENDLSKVIKTKSGHLK